MIKGLEVLEKNCPIFQKVAQKAKKMTNIYNKAQNESPKYLLHQATFETSNYLQQTMF
jgi:hypothetical protein